MSTTSTQTLDPSGSLPVPATRGCDGVVCFGGIDWWYHNRGHSECQVMTRLAREMPVLWVNSIGMRAPAVGRTELLLSRYARKFRSTLKGLRRDPESGMWVYSPLFVPRYNTGWLRFNGHFLALQINLLRWWLGMRDPAAWVTTPTAVEPVERMRWSRIVFNRSDEFSQFPEANTRFIADLEERLLRLSDDVLYTSHTLMNREAHLCRSAEYLGHGVDYDRFSRAREIDRPAELPESIRHLPRPIVGYYGALDDYAIDKELLIRVARQIAPGTLLIIGPKAMDTASIEAEPNVHYMGQVPYTEVPRYAGAFDVAIMPWLMNDWIESCNPIKLREYLAVGFPVVTTTFPELAPYRDLVYGVTSHEDFLASLDEALHERDPERVRQRRAAVRDSTWDGITRRVSEILMDGGPPSPGAG